ncbi:MAG TPA: PilZ domain-containing protein [bacterium]|nr:PilZ domain-containing protein [bacterium]
MEDPVWTNEYQQFLQQCVESGHLDKREPNQEHRLHPRFRLWSNIVWTTGDFQFAIVDLSVSGIAFDANRAFEPDREIVVRLSDLISVRARVIGCNELDTTPMFFTGRYRVRCHFEDSVEGLRFLVMVKDMKQLRIET